MGDAKVNLPVIKSALNTVSTNVSTIVSRMGSIDQNYVQGTYDKWNSPDAAKYIDSLLIQLNDFSSQFNSKISQAVIDFATTVNDLCKAKQAGTVDIPELSTLEEISRGWSPEEENFTTTDTYGTFTTQNLTNHLRSIKSSMESSKAAIKNAQAVGLSGEFCSQLVSGFSDLITSADEVLNTYDSKAAEKAANQDTGIINFKANT